MTRAGATRVVALVLVVAALGVWLGVGGRRGTTNPPLRPTTTSDAPKVTALGPVTLTAAELEARAGSLGQDVYWLGPQPGRRYQLERTAAADVFVRYLAAGTNDATTVGTYPLENAYAATGAFAAEHGWAQEHVEAWLVVAPASSRTEVYLAAQGFPYQIEVYDPTPGRAQALVETGAVTPVR
jgi:hypothetical protein